MYPMGQSSGQEIVGNGGSGMAGSENPGKDGNPKVGKARGMPIDGSDGNGGSGMAGNAKPGRDGKPKVGSDSGIPMSGSVGNGGSGIEGSAKPGSDGSPKTGNLQRLTVPRRPSC